MAPPAEDKTVRVGAGDPAVRGTSDDTLPPRSRIGGRYEIVECLGSGGMGVVYLALDEALDGKPVALKIVARDRTDEAQLAQLRREVLLAQQVTHHNVCRIYDLEQLDGRWMIKMEVISGETLAERLARRRLDIADAVDIARQIAHGLGAAHAQGVIHRDLKPSNVMIEELGGRVVLMDFGIARPEGSDASSDRAGTPAYMAPEQVRGERIGPRSDIYALGCVLYQMLVGAAVFDGSSTQEVSERQVTSVPPDARTGRPGVPSWLARAIRRMLEKDPERRPADAAAVLRLLVDPSRRRLAIGLGVVAAAAVLAVVALVASRGGSRHAAPSWRPAVREIEPAYDENADSVAFSPDGTSIVTSSDRERPGWLRGRIRPVAGSADDLVVTPPDMNALMVGWTRDGQSLLFTDIAGGMKAFRMHLAGGRLELIGDGYAIDCGGNILRYEFGSPGCPTCPRFVLRDADGAEREVLRLDSSAFVTTYRCDRAGERVVWSRAELGAPFYQPSDLWLADLATGKSRKLTDDRKRNCYPTFTPDGRSIVFTSARGGGVMNLWEMPLDGGAPHQLTSGNGNDLLADVSPDGSQVVFTVDVTSAPLFAYTGGVRRRVTPSRAILIDPQVTPDGSAVIAADFAPLAPRIVAIAVADGAVRELGGGVIAAITPDGRDVVYAADGVPARLFAVPFTGATGEPRALGELPGRIRMLRVGTDGVVHAMVDRETAIEAWRVPLADGEPAREADAPWCFVQPAPAGGWAMWMRCTPGEPLDAVAVARGATPDPAAPGHRMQGPMFQGGDFTAAGDAYLFYDQPQIERLDLASGATTTISEIALYGATVSPDGQTIYTTEAVGSARRHLLTNFGSRLR